MIVSTFSTPNPKKGNQLIIECRVSGIPPPMVTWMKDDNIFSGNDTIDRINISMIHEGVARIRIKSAIIEDSGVYICTASNDAGSASDMLQVQVNGKCHDSILILLANNNFNSPYLLIYT